MTRILALVAACALSACASTYVANANDPVDMAAELGNRGAQYVGMGRVCDAQVGGDYSGVIAQAVAREQNRLGVLRSLVNRAYRGQASETLRLHMQAEMAEHGVTAAQFCDQVVLEARNDLGRRADEVLALGNGEVTMSQARDRGWIE